MLLVVEQLLNGLQFGLLLFLLAAGLTLVLVTPESRMCDPLVTVKVPVTPPPFEALTPWTMSRVLNANPEGLPSSSVRAVWTVRTPSGVAAM